MKHVLPVRCVGAFDALAWGTPRKTVDEQLIIDRKREKKAFELSLLSHLVARKPLETERMLRRPICSQAANGINDVTSSLL